MTEQYANQTSPQSRPFWKKKRAWLLVFIILMIPVQYLNHTGFCYEEGRYLSERELMDRVIFGKDKWKRMTEAERAQAIKDMGDDYYGNYSFDGRPFWNKGFSYFLDKTFGWYRYGFRKYRKKNPDELANSNLKDGIYYESLLSTNACGRSYNENWGISIGESYYSALFKRNQKYWSGELRNDN